MRIGYARVSTTEQNLDLQLDALKAAGCEKIFTDSGISGSKSDRPGLAEALSFCRAGDTFVVWKLDRLGRSMKGLIDWLQQLEERKIEFSSISEAIDTTSPIGRCMFHLCGAFAQLERDLIRERTKAGLKAARARGRRGGRPKALKPRQVQMGVALAKDKQLTVLEICEQLGIARSTYYREIAPLLPKPEIG